MKTKRITVVEDEYILALDIKRMLTESGFSLITLFHSGEDLIASIKKEIPSLILMDINLKGKLDGIETAKIVRLQYDIPIIYLTGMSDKESVSRAKETNPYGFIYKPFEQRDLYANIETALYKHNLENELKRSEEKYKSLYDNMLDGFVRIDSTGLITEYNEAFRSMLGYSNEEIINLKYTDITPAKWHEIENQIIQEEIFPHGYSRVYEKEYIRKDGSIFPAELRTYLSKSSGEKNDSMWAIVRDISERKRTEQILSETNERYRALSEITTDSASSTIIYPDGSFHKEWEMGNLLEQYGFENNDIDSIDKWKDCIHPDDLDNYQTQLKSILSGNNISVELRIRTKSGDVRWISNSIYPKIDEKSAKVIKLLNVVKDITDRKKAEEEKLKLQYQLLAALDQASAGIIITDAPDVSFRILNKAAEKILISPENKTKKQVTIKDQTWKICHPDGTEYSQNELPLVQILATGRTFSNHEMKVIRQDKTEKWILLNGAPIRDIDNTIIGGIVVFTDSSDLKDSIAAYNQSELKYHETVDLLPLGVYECDMSGRITFANHCAYDYFQYNEDDFFKGINIFDVIIPDNITKAKTSFENLINKQIITDFTYTGLRKDGSTFPLEIHSSIITENGKPSGIRGVLIDLTAKKRIEDELFKANKLESVGILAGGIAHDFNNILTAILGNISLLKMSVAKDDKMYDLLNDAEKAGFRAKDLTQQLLTFSRGGSPVKENTSIAGILYDASAFVLRGAQSVCRYDIPDSLWPIIADKGQIAQVIQNLVINANQAMPKGGTIHLSARNIECTENDYAKLPSGKYVSITIKDEGIGIPVAILPNIFDPYFTTKQTGSGLGLSICYSIIKNHGGKIDVRSSIGKGTSFILYLPAADSAQTPVIQEKTFSSLKGRGKILLMDDDSMIHDFLKSLLNKFGYTVDSAFDGLTAISLYAEAFSSANPYNLVIMDLTIPGGMGGKETIRELRSIDPAVKAIVTSGYSTDPIMSVYEDFGFAGILPKPFDNEELLNKIKTIIQVQSPN